MCWGPCLPSGSPPSTDFFLYSASSAGDIFHSSVGSFVLQPYQPERSLPLKSAVNPAGGTLFPAKAGTAAASARRMRRWGIFMVGWMMMMMGPGWGRNVWLHPWREGDVVDALLPARAFFAR